MIDTAGESVFGDNADTLVTEKIIKQAKKNVSNPESEAVKCRSDLSPEKNYITSHFLKKWLYIIVLCLLCLLIISNIFNKKPD